MGIKGLLPFLKDASCKVNLREFSGFSAAIDAYCWIHKSSFACAMDLALGNPTDQYVRYALKYLEMILSCNVKPILVFDGANLPSKSETELKRKESKEAYRRKAAEYLLEGNHQAAQECFERSIFVTPEMAHNVIKAARNMGVDCIVAPYEADAQLAYLNKAGYADLVITEDSDLLLFGCRQVIFKLDMTGSGILVAWSAGLGERCCGMRPGQFTESTLRFMGILAGCDYFSGIPGIGLTTAAKILRQTRLTVFRELLSKLGLYVNLNVAALSATIGCREHESSLDSHAGSSSGSNGKRKLGKKLHDSIINAAVRAERTFRLQVVFDPSTRKQLRLSEPDVEDIADELGFVSHKKSSEHLFAFAGQVLQDDQQAFQLALGNVNFDTGAVVDHFDPDAKKDVASGLRAKPLSDSNLLNYLSRPINHASIGTGSDYAYSTTSTLPVLGHVGKENHPLVLDKKNHPDAKRLSMSIWDKSFPTQKVWIHRPIKLASTDVQSVHCVTVSTTDCDKIASSGPTETHSVQQSRLQSSNCEHDASAEPVGRRSYSSTLHTDQLTASHDVNRKLLRFQRHTDLGKTDLRTSNRNSPVVNDAECDILHGYEMPLKTPTIRSAERSFLSSAVMTSSCYFSSKHTENRHSFVQRSSTDDVACALSSALNDNSTNATTLLTTPPQSPVFNRNPFCVSPVFRGNSVFTATGNESPQLRSPQFSSVAQSGSRSPIVSGTSVVSSNRPSLFEDQITPLETGSAATPIFDCDSPDPENECFDDTRDLSPSFLNAHCVKKLVQDRSSLVLESERTSATRLTSSPDRPSMLRFSSLTNNPPHMKTHKSVTKRKRTVVNSPPTSTRSRSDLHPFFQKWQFKRSTPSD